MTKLSVNINKIALLRNARGRDFPSVEQFANRCIDLGAQGITLHPRPDQRHARYADVATLKTLCDARGVELNVEGYPCEAFMEVVVAARPTQCTLVPDDPNQITSDHGWEIVKNRELLSQTLDRLRAAEIRSSVFVDHGCPELEQLREMGGDRIELYTEPYAEAYATPENREAILSSFGDTANAAQQLGLGVNAGHDLDLKNLGEFVSIAGILEVSIGHALVVECIEHGIEHVIPEYLRILAWRTACE